MQALQCCAGHPVLAVSVLPDKSNNHVITMSIDVSNNESELQHFGKAVQLATFTVTRERWNHITLDLKPSPCDGPNDGKVIVSVNENQITNWRGCWGYTPAEYSTSEGGQVLPNVGFDVGIYRRRQPLRQTILIDNIHVGRPEDHTF